MNMKTRTSIAIGFVLCLLPFLVACGIDEIVSDGNGESNGSWELIDQRSEPYVTKQLGDPITAAEDGQMIHSLQGDSISQTFSASLKLSVSFIAELEAVIDYELSLDSISLSGTTERLEKKGQTVTFYLQDMCEVFIVKDLTNGTLHEIYNWSGASISYAVVVEDVDGIVIKDTRGSAEGKWSGLYDSEGKFSGYGTYTDSDGSVYTGYAVKGLWHGQGTIKWANGDEYVGTWENGKRSGLGKEIWVNNGEYVGAVANDERNGHGTFTLANGDRYVGEYKDDMANGQGLYIWADGSMYIGAWENDVKTYGTIFHSDGSTSPYPAG